MSKESANVTIESLSHDSSDSLVVAPIKESSPIQDMGVVELSVPEIKTEAVETPVSAISKESDPILNNGFAISSISDHEKIDNQTDDKNNLKSDFVQAAKILRNYQSSLSLENKSLVLDKDSFGPSFQKVLELLSLKDPQVVGAIFYLENSITGPQDLATSIQSQELEVLLEKVKQEKLALAQKVDLLLSTFANGNNWPRLLAAWQILTQPQFADIVEATSWFDSISKLSLDLFGSSQLEELFTLSLEKDFQLTDYLNQHFSDSKKDKKNDTSLTKQQQEQLLFFINPILENFLLDKAGTLEGSKEISEPLPAPTTLDSVIADEQISKTKQAISDLRQEIKQNINFQAQIDAAQEENIANQADQVNISSEEIKRLNKELTAINQEKVDFQTQIEALEAKIEELLGSLEGTELENASLKQNLYRANQNNHSEQIVTPIDYPDSNNALIEPSLEVSIDQQELPSREIKSEPSPESVYLDLASGRRNLAQPATDLRPPFIPEAQPDLPPREKQLAKAQQTLENIRFILSGL